MPIDRSLDTRPHFWVPSVAGLLFLAATIVFAGCNRGSSKAKTDGAEKAGSSSSTAAAQPAKNVNVDHPVVQIETSAGSITLKLDAVNAPGTVRNFLNYANERFYDESAVHYVDPSKMIVAGGYSTDLKPKSAHTPIRNEAHNGLKNTRGTIAMARDASRIDSATSQFFINLADAPQRDHTGDKADNYGYCVFGAVTEGLDVAEKISKSTTTDQGGDLAQTPNPPVVIKSVRVVP